MKKKTTKREVRNQVNEEIEQFLQQGGEVTEVARGESGLVDGRYHERSMSFDKRQERTPVDDVLKAIDQRKEAKRSRPARKAPPRKVPKQKVIYDDFGEPLRVVWQDE